MAMSGCAWLDIEELIQDVAEELQVSYFYILSVTVLTVLNCKSGEDLSVLAQCIFQEGELLHDDHFSLYEAMSAVEIGDPKLDAGMCVHPEPK